MGDPAIYFRVLLSDAAAKKFVDAAIKRKKHARELIDAIRASMEEQIEPLGEWGLFPHFTFCNVSEQAYLPIYLRDKEWD